MEMRHEPRTNESFVVTINGRDKDGHFFKEQVVASRISKSGALLSGLSRHVRLGDVISVAYGGKKSRFKVVWLTKGLRITSPHPSCYTPNECREFHGKTHSSRADGRKHRSEQRASNAAIYDLRDRPLGNEVTHAHSFAFLRPKAQLP
jgi:hypothetical protein